MRGNGTLLVAERTRLPTEIMDIERITPAGSEPHDVNPIVGVSEPDLNLLDAFYHQLALDAAEDPRPNTSEEDADVAWLIARARQRMSISAAEGRAQRARERR